MKKYIINLKYNKFFNKIVLPFIITFIIINILQFFNQFNFLSFIFGVIIEGICFNIYDKFSYYENFYIYIDEKDKKAFHL